MKKFLKYLLSVVVLTQTSFVFGAIPVTWAKSIQGWNARYTSGIALHGNSTARLLQNAVTQVKADLDANAIAQIITDVTANIAVAPVADNEYNVLNHPSYLAAATNGINAVAVELDNLITAIGYKTSANLAQALNNLSTKLSDDFLKVYGTNPADAQFQDIQAIKALLAQTNTTMTLAQQIAVNANRGDLRRAAERSIDPSALGKNCLFQQEDIQEQAAGELRSVAVTPPEPKQTGLTTGQIIGGASVIAAALAATVYAMTSNSAATDQGPAPKIVEPVSAVTEITETQTGKNAVKAAIEVVGPLTDLSKLSKKEADEILNQETFTNACIRVKDLLINVRDGQYKGLTEDQKDVFGVVLKHKLASLYTKLNGMVENKEILMPLKNLCIEHLAIEQETTTPPVVDEAPKAPKSQSKLSRLKSSIHRLLNMVATTTNAINGQGDDE